MHASTHRHPHVLAGPKYQRAVAAFTAATQNYNDLVFKISGDVAMMFKLQVHARGHAFAVHDDLGWTAEGGRQLASCIASVHACVAEGPRMRHLLADPHFKTPHPICLCAVHPPNSQQDIEAMGKQIATFQVGGL